MKHQSLFLGIILIQLFFASVFAQNFPQPDILQADVNFWLKVYTQADTRSGYIHDAYNLAVVYDKITIKGGPRANKKHIKQTKAKFKSVLKSLASGKRTNLSKDERHVLSLWGEGVSNKRLLKAASDIRFQRGQSDRFHRGLERSGEWRNYINKTFTDMNLPVELSVLPHVESSFNPKAYSHVGAAGIWQFIRSTGKRYMRIDHVIDERMDPFVSTIAAAKLLSHNHDLTQSWPLALTAYNHGVASMRRAINKLGTRDIAIIVRKYKGRSFGFASRNFYVAFLAALEVDRYPEKYFTSTNYAKPFDYQTVPLNAYYFAKDIAKNLGVSKSQLKLHNRALLESVWSGTKRIPKGYVLRVPSVLLSQPIEQLIASIPNESRYMKQTADEFHYVQRGDTISEIADEYGFKIKDILAANNLNSAHYIRAGQKLRLPVNGIPSAKRPSTTQKDTAKVTVAAVDKTITDKTVPAENVSAETVTVDAVAVDSRSQLIANKEPNTNIDAEETEVTQPSISDTTNIDDQRSADSDVSVVAEPETDVQGEPVLLSDPADYTVDENNSIEVHASETLGHYAEWLDIRASRLRQINNMKFAEPVVLGRRIKLDFAEVTQDVFEKRRIAYQKKLQGLFFTRYRIDSTSQYVIKGGESVWVLALRKFKVPIWLLRQHNPDVDFHRIKPGEKITVPVLIEVQNT